MRRPRELQWRVTYQGEIKFISSENFFSEYRREASANSFSDIYNGYYDNIDGARKFINNLGTSYYETQFKKAQYLSNYYIEDASFIRCDNITIGYNFKDLIGNKIGLTVSGVVQNVFVISDYSGLDPEIYNGIDNNIYPRPTIYSLNINLKL